jgi:hypothetical protein
MLRSQGIADNQASPVTRLFFYFVKRRLGRIPLGVRIRAFVPKYLRKAAGLDIYCASPGLVSMHLKELAQLKTALMVGCPF